jgi:two-component system KDP operon response regulator KdpE
VDWILIVEDDQAYAEVVIARALEPRPVRIAHSVAAARELLRAASPQAAIIDVGLPDGDGLDLAEWLRRGMPTLPILILTGDLSDERVRRAAALGCDAVLKDEYRRGIPTFLQLRCQPALQLT